MSQTQHIKSASCTTCGTNSPPQVFKITKGNQLVTEAHYVCNNPRCRTRFRVAVINTEEIKSE